MNLRFSFLLVPLLALGFLAGCASDDSSDSGGLWLGPDRLDR